MCFCCFIVWCFLLSKLFKAICFNVPVLPKFWDHLLKNCDRQGNRGKTETRKSQPEYIFKKIFYVNRVP